MFLTFEDRPSSSPFIERVWRCHSATGGMFYSMAEGNLELVVTRLEGLTLPSVKVAQTPTAWDAAARHRTRHPDESNWIPFQGKE